MEDKTSQCFTKYKKRFSSKNENNNLSGLCSAEEMRQNSAKKFEAAEIITYVYSLTRSIHGQKKEDEIFCTNMKVSVVETQ